MVRRKIHQIPQEEADNRGSARCKYRPFGVNKIGVPSMGGIIIIVALLIPVILLGRLRNIYLILMIITTIWLGFLGGMDDFIKIFKHNKEGLKGKYKIIGQFTIG